jgi:hypothetical protein
MDPMLAALARYRPTVATGVARRQLDGADSQDATAFVYAAPDRWRVRRADGSELVVTGSVWWTRRGPDEAWTREEDAHGRTVHHSGYVQDMLFPGRLQVLTDPRTTLAYAQARPDGSLQLLLEVVEPEPLRLALEVAAAGYITHVEAVTPGGRRVALMEMAADVTAGLDPAIFDPAFRWDPPPPPWPRDA